MPHLHGNPSRRGARHQAHGRKGVAGLRGIAVAQAQRADSGAPLCIQWSVRGSKKLALLCLKHINGILVAVCFLTVQCFRGIGSQLHRAGVARLGSLVLAASSTRLTVFPISMFDLRKEQRKRPEGDTPSGLEFGPSNRNRTCI